jgi:arginase family enzyme
MDVLTLRLDAPSRVIQRSFFAQGSKGITPFAHHNINKVELVDLLEEAIPERYKESKEPTIVLYGNGAYHHYTYGLCSVLADRRSDAYAYIHLDQHHDMWNDTKEDLNCGRFTRSLLQDTHAQMVILCGIRKVDDDCKGKDILYVPHNINYPENFKSILRNVPDDVYVSIDLDVLTSKEMQTGWPDGLMPFETLEENIMQILGSKRVIGADILGWNKTKLRRDESLQVYKRLVQLFTKKQERAWQKRVSHVLTRF